MSVCMGICGASCSPGALLLFLFFFNDTATTEIYTLSLHDALPILVVLSLRIVTIGAELVLHQGGDSPMKVPGSLVIL